MTMRADCIALIFLALPLLGVGSVRAEKEGNHHASEPARCAAPGRQERHLRYTDFRWFYTRTQMSEKYAEIYTSGKRLIDRARWNDKTNRYELVYQSGDTRQTVPITSEFIDSVRSHIERGMKLGYVRHVFFPDMGHAHLLIPRAYYDDVIQPIPVSRQHEVYIHALAHPDTRFLYHTAEQLRMLDQENELLPERYLGWRYFTRNLVGRNDSRGILEIHRNLESIGNTVCQVGSSHRYWSAGFHVSASEKGCFGFQHGEETFYFDISLRDLTGTADSRGAPLTVDVEPQNESISNPTVWGAHTCR